MQLLAVIKHICGPAGTPQTGSYLFIHTAYLFSQECVKATLYCIHAVSVLSATVIVINKRERALTIMGCVYSLVFLCAYILRLKAIGTYISLAPIQLCPNVLIKLVLSTILVRFP